jgi:hypothetical protein
MHKIFKMPFADVYPLYVKKVERKGRTVAELHEALEWLTGFNEKQIASLVEAKTNFEDFFDKASLNPGVNQIKGVICGVRIEEIEDPLMQKIRYMDKLVDEIAKGRPMAKVLRQNV